jgi:hyperosmotically inducible protein
MKTAVYCLSLSGTMTFLLIFNFQLYVSMTDDRIESSAKQSYVFKTYLKSDAIKIQSRDGVVTLTGSVSEESRKSLAQEMVVSLAGVKGVDNKLAVKGAVPAVQSDTRPITNLVKPILPDHRLAGALGSSKY